MIGASDLPRVNLDFTEQPPIPEAGIRRAGELMASGRLFRYGETGAAGSDVAGLEDDFATLVGRRFCVAFNSCGASLAAALMAIGVERDEPVLMNAFTLAPVPGAVGPAGGGPGSTAARSPGPTLGDPPAGKRLAVPNLYTVDLSAVHTRPVRAH